jgi:hypothetical protein
VFVITQGEALVIVAAHFDTAAWLPTAVLQLRSGILNVVDPSPTQNVVHITEYNVA